MKKALATEVWKGNWRGINTFVILRFNSKEYYDRGKINVFIFPWSTYFLSLDQAIFNMEYSMAK